MRASTFGGNPFAATKANDLEDSQIQNLWVDVFSIDGRLGAFSHPGDGYMPVFVLGGKGSGKTHLMRYHSFELQSLRHGNGADVPALQQGIQGDGYLGIYALCGSINSSRFSGKGQPSEKWSTLFAYYLELWLAHHLLQITTKLGLSVEQQKAFCRDAVELFDKVPQGTDVADLATFLEFLTSLQRDLDFQVTNAVMTGAVDVAILASRGKLLFGIPRLLSTHFEFLSDVVFLYCIDEFENLTEQQQQVVNSYVRDKERPSTLRVGSRLYGVKTHKTDGVCEENLRESEYRLLPLDRVFRQHKTKYVAFAKELIAKRIEVALDRPMSIESLFASVDDSWNSTYFRTIVSEPSFERKHFKHLATQLSPLDVKKNSILAALSCEEYPLLEKLNVLLFYQNADAKKVAMDVAEDIGSRCRLFQEKPSLKSSYRQSLEHYKSDLVAQLRRENRASEHLYLGLETFIDMSAGLPRALLTILRSIFEWSVFQGEDPLLNGTISIEAQSRGVRDASAWFYDHMRKAGDEQRPIQLAIGRLGQLFRINRFAQKPIEVSLSSFSLDPSIGTNEAKKVLRLAEERSFLIQVPGGGKDKNSGDPLLKYQISPMLAPRWDLPIMRRGTVTLSANEFNSIFDPGSDAFERVVADWNRRTSVRWGAPPENVQAQLI